MSPSSEVPAPLVSVIIPTRHRLRLLQRALDSIDAQDYAAVEVILVDNFADAPLLASDVRSRFPLRVVRTARMQPLPTNRNLGASHARGELLCFLDDDDVYTPIKLRRAVEALQEDPSADFVYANTEQIGPHGESLCVAGGEPEIKSFLRWRYIHTNALMIRRRVFEQVRYLDAMTTYEDVEFTSRLFRLGYKAKYLPETHAIWYRDGRADQMTRRNWRRAYENWQRLCDFNHDVIVSDKDLRRFYHRKMLALSLLQRDVRQAVRSARLAF
jgi:glycosyltransferase involved in cell wall biosynthesis